MHIDVVGDIHVSVSQQLGEDLHIDALVIAVRRKRVTENMLSSVSDVSGFAKALGLIP